MNSNLEKYIHLLERYSKFNDNKIPLCAAENYTSNFVKNPLNSIWEGKYCMSNINFNEEADFIGAEYIHELLNLVSNQCRTLFSAAYVNAKTLTGMNCFSTTVLSCEKLLKGKRALVVMPSAGGHASVPKILKAFGFEIDEMPYDYANYDINYEDTNKLLKSKFYDLLVFAQSDLLKQADIDKLQISPNSILLFDATQTLGLIASKLTKNPLLCAHEKTILIGGTHKTLPGSSCGLIMTNNNYIKETIDTHISPVFIRNSQPNNIASLLMALIEAEEIGYSYQLNTILTANMLANKLSNKNFNMARINHDRFSNTHQIFMLLTEEKMSRLYKSAINYGITLNKKTKPLFSGFGIRLGVQEISRYDWKDSELNILADLFCAIDCDDDKKARECIAHLITRKTPNYIFM